MAIQIKNVHVENEQKVRASMTPEAWEERCRARLYDLLEENKDVFVRLADR